MASDSPDQPSVWLDGRLFNAAEPHIAVADRGFQLGDAVFETLRARRGVAIELREHLARLRESAGAMAIPVPLDDAGIASALAELLAAAGLADAGTAPGQPVGDAAVRITLSRGAAGRGLAAPATPRPALAIQAWPYVPPDAALLERGLRAITSSIRHDPTSPLHGIKTTSRADLVWARNEAGRAGADEAILLTNGGRLAESLTANVWLARGDVLLTPPLAAGILAGTTRSWLLARPAAPQLADALRTAGIARVDESDLGPTDMRLASEAFVSSSVAGIVPLTRFDDQPIGRGRPGPLTMALRDAREAWIDAQSLVGAGSRP